MGQRNNGQNGWTGNGGTGRLASVFPILVWLPAYRKTWLKDDLIAGFTLAAYAVPVAMAYSSLAGLSPQVGIYCYIFGGFVYAFFASSRQLAIGPTAAISLMLPAVIGAMSGGNARLYGTIAAQTAGTVALIYILAWLFRLNAFVNFISETNLLGFKAGAALSIAATQLPKLFGVPGGGDDFFTCLLSLFRHLAATNPATLLLGVVALAVLAVGERLFPTRPVALVLVALSVIAASSFHLGQYGIMLVGEVPRGLPAFSFPYVGSEHAGEIAELAFACFLLSYIESISAARTFALKHDYPIDPRQELLGLGAANLAAALGHGYPVAGGLSQSVVNEESRARTPLSLVVASAMLCLVLEFLTGLLRALPEVVLAAIVLVAVSSLIQIADFRNLWRVSRNEFLVAVVALVAVLTFGILKGVMISAVASILFLLRYMASPHVAILGRIPGTRRFSDAERHPDNESIPGVLLFRVEAPLLYFNVENIDQTVLARIHGTSSPVRLVVCDLSTSPYVDAAGAKMLAKLEAQLAGEGIQFRIADAHAEVRDILRAAGVDRRFGGVSRLTSVENIIAEFDRS